MKRLERVTTAISFTYTFRVVIKRDGNAWMASCPELKGALTEGKTWEEAYRNIQDAITVYMKSVIKHCND
jgi:predicted RNase H-like HicB family nuclease